MNLYQVYMPILINVYYIIRSMSKRFTELPLEWHQKPETFAIQPTYITITTAPNTDYWQRTYYNFQNDSGPILFAQL